MFTLVLFAAALAGAPVPATGKTPDPIATFQFAPAEVLEKDLFRLMATMPMPDTATAVKQMKDQMSAVLGEKGWDGLDTKKPGTGYVIFDEKNHEKTYGFLVLPAKDEKSFLEFLGRVGKGMEANNTLVAVERLPGVYHMKGKNDDVPKHVRVHNGYAYIGINAPLDAFAADKLLAPEKTLDPKETAKIAVTLRINKVPRELIAKGLEELGRVSADGRRTFPSDAPVAVKEAYDRGNALARQYADLLIADGDTLGVRVRYDDDLSYEFYLRGKAGTTLAKAIAARAPTTNRFAGLVSEKAVGGFVMKLPFLNDDVRAISAKAVTDSYKELCEKDPPPADLKPLFDKLAPALSSTIKSGQFDVAAALHGPDAKAGYTAVLGVALDGADGLTPEVKALVNAKAEGIVEWDANDAGGVKIHTLNVMPLLPGEAKKVFGNNGTCHFALTKAGLVFAMGRESLSEIKRAVALNPIPAPVFDLKVNNAKFVTLLDAFHPQTAEQLGGAFGKADKLVSYDSLAVTGGEELRVVMRSTFFTFAGLFTSRIGIEGAPPPPLKK